MKLKKKAWIEKKKLIKEKKRVNWVNLPNL